MESRQEKGNGRKVTREEAVKKLLTEIELVQDVVGRFLNIIDGGSNRKVGRKNGRECLNEKFAMFSYMQTKLEMLESLLKYMESTASQL